MWPQMEEKQHLSSYKAVRASCHNNEQLFWHHPVQDRAEDARLRRASRARKGPHTDDFLHYDD